MEYIGDEMYMLDTSEEEDDGVLINTLRRGDELHRTISNLNYETQEWFYANYATQTEVRGVREHNEIRITGIVEGQPFEKVIVVNFDPWYQLLEPAIRHFVGLKRPQQRFWILDPGSISEHHMVVNGKDFITMKKGDDFIPAVNVTVTFTGALSSVWSAQYWYDAHTKEFLHYETASDSPSVKSIRITPLY